MNKDLIARKSVKVFDGTKLDESLIKGLIESCNLTPTSLGIQPVRLITVSNLEKKRELSFSSFNQPQIMSCSHLFIFSIMDRIDENYTSKYMKLISETRGTNESKLNAFSNTIHKWFENQTESEYLSWARSQAYLTLGVFISKLASLGVDACAMEGFSPLEYDSILGLDKLNLKSVIICAVGTRSSECPRGAEKKVRLSQSDYNPLNFN